MKGSQLKKWLNILMKTLQNILDSLDFYQNRCWECCNLFDTKNKRQYTCDSCWEEIDNENQTKT